MRTNFFPPIENPMQTDEIIINMDPSSAEDSCDFVDVKQEPSETETAVSVYKIEVKTEDSIKQEVVCNTDIELESSSNSTIQLECNPSNYDRKGPLYGNGETAVQKDINYLIKELKSISKKKRTTEEKIELSKLLRQKRNQKYYKKKCTGQNKTQEQKERKERKEARKKRDREPRQAAKLNETVVQNELQEQEQFLDKIKAEKEDMIKQEPVNNPDIKQEITPFNLDIKLEVDYAHKLYFKYPHETEEQKEARKKIQREYTRAVRANETKEQKEMRKKQQREHTRAKRANLTDEEREIVRQQNREQRRIARTNETEEQKEARRNRDREQKRAATENETEEQKEARKQNQVTVFCDQCSFNTTQKGNLKKHVQAVHEKITYSCDKCDPIKMFSRKSYLKTHIQSVHEQVKYPCNQCDYQAAQKKTLQVHIRSMHEKFTYFCDKCEYQTVHITSLRIHIDNIHNNITYPCDQCDYMAKRKGDLKLHVDAIHNKITYLCEECTYSSTDTSNLKRHIRAMHQNSTESIHIDDIINTDMLETKEA